VATKVDIKKRSLLLVKGKERERRERRPPKILALSQGFIEAFFFAMLLISYIRVVHMLDAN
jgi:hypothetical protein